MTTRIKRPSPALEIEAKLLVRRERHLRAIAALRTLGQYQLRLRRSARLHSIYVDTTDRRLIRHGVAIRLRRQAGHWELTAKWSGQVRGLLHARPELNVPLMAQPRFPYQLDRPLSADIAALVGDEPLCPILITTIHRRYRDVLRRDRSGLVLAEMALDRVHLRAPDGRPAAPPYFEIEIERRRGTRRDLGTIAAALQERFALVPSRESKFARGLQALKDGRRVR